MCQHISGCKWMSLNIGSIYILKYLGILPKTRIYGSSESAKYCDQSKVDEVLVSCGRHYHNMIIIVWYDELYYHGVNFFNLVKPLYPKSNRTWATGLQDLHWDFQSQVIQMKMYFQYYFDIFQYYFWYYMYNFLGSWPQRSQAGSGDMETRGAVFWGFFATPHKICIAISSSPWPGLLSKCQGGRVPVCYGSQSTSEHQAPWSDSIYAQVSIFMQTSQSYS